MKPVLLLLRALALPLVALVFFAVWLWAEAFEAAAQRRLGPDYEGPRGNPDL